MSGRNIPERRDPPGIIARGVSAWVAIAQRRAPMVVLLMLVLVGVCGWYTATHIAINTDNADMISRDVSWRQTYIDYLSAFSQYTDNLVVVIDGENAGQVERARRMLTNALRDEPELFKQVYAPGGGAFFRQNGLLYLSLDELEALARRLTQVQPFLGSLSRDPGMDNLLSLLSRAMGESSDSQPFELTPVYRELARAFVANSEDRFFRMPWRALMFDEAGQKTHRQYIELQPVLDYGALSPASAAMSRIRALADELDFDPKHGLRVRLTGQAALEGEELASVSQGAALGATLALLAVGIILFLALRSLRLVAAAIITLLAGLTGTAAFAAAAVGTLNLISVAFAVLYIGLGIDYTIHLALRYRELLPSGLTADAAMHTAAGDVGVSLFVCAVSTAVGFYAFIPTAYAGVAELGLIAGTGMFISLFATLTLMPALLRLMPAPVSSAPVPGRVPPALAAWPQSQRRLIVMLALLAAVAAVVTLPQVRFNADTLDLKNPDSESVSTFRDLMRNAEQSPQSLSVITDDLNAAENLSRRLAQLDGVKQAISIADYVPADQQKKLAVIEDLAFTLALREPAPVPRSSMVNHYRSVVEFKQAVNRKLGQDAQTVPDSIQRLNEAMETWNSAMTRAPLLLRQERLAALEQILVAAIPPLIMQLRESLNAQPISLETLPGPLRERWISPDGRYRVEAFPAANLDNDAATAAFVDAVQQVAPQATGAAVLEQSAGNTVVGAFVAAFSYAVLIISVLLVLLLKNVADSLRVISLLALVALLVAAATVFFGIPFNFANIIALPLLFGVGVDSAIHVVHRMRNAPPDSGLLLTTSTARAVFFSGLTTIAGFGVLAFSQHDGTASMGELLAIGMLVTLLCTLVVLPSLLPKTAASQPQT